MTWQHLLLQPSCVLRSYLILYNVVLSNSFVLKRPFNVLLFEENKQSIISQLVLSTLTGVFHQKPHESEPVNRSHWLIQRGGGASQQHCSNWMEEKLTKSSLWGSRSSLPVCRFSSTFTCVAWIMMSWKTEGIFLWSERKLVAKIYDIPLFANCNSLSSTRTNHANNNEQ